ncbi:MAG: FG-GAP-like repeat-containing protein [Bacteroidota bacterium]
MQIKNAFRSYTCCNGLSAGKLLSFGIIAFLCFSSYRAEAQSFVNSTVTWTAPELSEAEVIFANVDNDFNNGPEILTAGKTNTSIPFTDIFRKVGNSYISNGSSILQLRDVSADFGDYDRDGNLDLAICGVDGSNVRHSLIYRGNGQPTGTYGGTAPISLSGAGVDGGSIKWGDYDNDGDLDLALMGETQSSGLIARVYENDNNSFIQDLTVNLTAMKDGELDWGDYDSDGDLDLIMTGMNGPSNNTPSTRIFQNVGNGNLIFTPVANLQNLGAGSVSWGDYDNDGDLDILLAGDNGTSLETQVLQNKGNSVFEAISTNFTGIRDGEAIWMDYNTDGWLDIVLAGKNGSTNADRTLELYLNTQNGSFNQINVTDFEGVDDGAAIAMGYIDTDKKPDLAVLGRKTFPAVFSRKLYDNINPTNNTTPLQISAPPLLTPAGSSINITWNPPPGAPANEVDGYSYNLFIGTNANDDDIEAGHADLSSGDRNFFHQGNIQGTSWTISGLPAGTYFVSVQAVDQDFEGGLFSATNSIAYTPPSSPPTVFEDRSSIVFPGSTQEGVRDGDLEWGDYDGDGDLDLLIVGGNAPGQNNGVVQVWQNIGGNNFTPSQVGLNASMDLSDAAWGDYDNDGDLDLLVSGQISSFGVSRLFENIGGTLVENTTLSGQIAGVYSGSVDWGDYDNDGDVDILLSGRGFDGATFLGPITRLYRNDYNVGTATRSFTYDSNASDDILPSGNFIGVEFGEALFGDFNKDGWLDFFVTGRDIGKVRAMYENNGDGTFSDFSSGISSITAVDQASVAFGDINNDGFLDLAVMGNDGTQPVAEVYQYVPLPPPFPSIYSTGGSFPASARLENGDIEFGDYNDDGYSDLIVSGIDFNGIARTKVLLNSGDGLGNFTEDLNASSNLADVSAGSSIAWADYDSDKKLDVAIAGALNGSSTYITRLYRNRNTDPNNIPNAPANLSQRLSGFDVEFSWDPPLNHPTNSVGGLTYAIYVDTTGGSGSVDVRSPNSNINTGIRSVVHMGEAGTNTSFVLKNLRPGSYNWSVQTIDQDFEGSAFAPTESFVYELPTFINRTDSLFTSIPPVSLDEANIAWGDYTGDGNLDLIVCGTDDNGNPATNLYEFDNGFFVDGGANSTALIDVKDGSVDWGDYDNDGDLDLLITGNDGSTPITRIFNNIGGGFTSVDTLQFLGVQHSAAEFADYNNDGLLDFVLSGERSNGNPVTRIYTQDNQGNFSVNNIGFGIKNAAIDWGDYNNDGYLDFIISGESNGSAGSGQLYTNNQNGGWVPSTGGLAPVVTGDLEFGDFDADGFLDIVQIGALSGGTRLTRILKNNRNGTFTTTSTIVEAVSDGSIVLGDYNNDGYKDIMVVGQNGGTTARSAKLYRYNPGTQNFVFEDVASSTFENVSGMSDAAWGDFDSDGKLDLAIVGENGTGPSFNIYRNIDQNPVSQPAAPTNLQDTVIGFEVLLTWQAVNNVANSRGLSYNIYLGTSNNSQNSRAAHSELNTGKRKLVKVGQVNDTTTFRLKNLTPGNYFWSVQAIDADFEGGPFAANAQTFIYSPPVFQDQTVSLFGTQPAGVDKGDLAWGDFDNDGDKDLLISGERGGTGVSQVLQNINGNSFINSGINLPDLVESHVQWVDVNQDNNIDIFISGKQANGSGLSRVYLSNGSGGYPTIWASPTGVFDGAADWADYDNDGDLDLVLMGEEGSGSRHFEIYRNDGTGLTPQIIGLPGISSGDVAFVDVDRDGYHDIFATGTDGANRTIYFLKNNGNGSFSGFTTSVFAAMDRAEIDWGDYNNDGFPDLIMCGNNGSGPTCRLYKNNGAGTFAPEAVLIGAENGSVVWGDYDNDGYLDLVVVGTGSSSNIAKVFRYDNIGDTFMSMDIGALPLQQVGDGAALAWGDYNNDGKLDMALLGETASGQSLKIYENIDTSTPYQLDAPVSLIDTVFGDTIILQWDQPPGYTDIDDGFTYNFYLGTAPNSTQIQSPMANVSSAYRKIPTMGNTGNNKSWSIIGLPAGTYYWKVQAIDQDYEGGLWTTERSFTYQPPAFRNENATRITGTPPTGYTNGDIALGDYDGDNDLDLIVSGLDESGLGSTAILKNKNGVFSFDNGVSSQFLNVFNSDVDWADYDNDGDLDAIVLGNVGNGNLATRIYDNLGAGSFSLNIRLSAILENVENGEVDWADYDHDGDLDLALTGANASGDPFSAVYENVRELDTFIVNTGINLVQVNESSVAWGDFNSDGYADLAIVGREGGILHAKVYRNNGPLGGFTDMGANAPLDGVQEGSIDWIDFDTDGFQDLLITGESTVNQVIPITRVYRYNFASGAFVSTGQILEGVKNGKGIWGDYNDDGYADFIISGQDGVSQGNRKTYLYTNNADGSFLFTRDDISSNYLFGSNEGSSPVFGDIDGDQKLDLILTGQYADASPRRGFTIYRNIDPTPNVTPDAPGISPAIISSDSVTFTWTPPANIPADILPAYSYQIRLRNPGGTTYFLSPMADMTTGLREIAANGGQGNATQWSIRGLPAGTYEWTVQAIGPDFEASGFTSPADTFTYSPPVFVNMNQLVFPNGLPEGLKNSSLDWGDFDKDGDLDLLVAGESASAAFGTYLYENVDGRTLELNTALSAKLADIRSGTVKWVDLNEDTWLDIALSGLSANGEISRIYNNETGGDFTENSFPLIPDLSNSQIDFGDYDNDGDLDIMISGNNGTADEIRVIRNDGVDGYSSPIPAVVVPADNNAQVRWVDVNNDGFLDILSGGDNGFQLLINTGNATFGSATTLSSIPSLTQVSFDCADVDRDGNTDLLISGYNGTIPFTDIFLGDGTGAFSASTAGLTALAGGKALFGDYSSDDRVDVLISGENASNAGQTLVFKQAANGTFTQDANASSNLEGLQAGDIAWGDYDNDGKLDLALSGEGVSDIFTIYRNIERTQNERPNAPANPMEEVDGSKVKLSWTAPNNAEGYTYNISIGVSANDEFVKAGMAELSSGNEGWRRVVAKGNVGQNLEWRIGGLVSGRQYSWRVQAIGPDFEGSEWATGAFTFNPPGFEEVTNNVFPNGVPGGLSNGVVASADYDQDGDIDFLLVGQSAGAGKTDIIRNEYNSGNGGRFVRDTDASQDLNDIQNASAVWGDYDNDGDADLIISGINNANPSNHVVFVYNNDGGRFTEDANAGSDLEPLSQGDMEMADFDNDGDLDLIISGNDANGVPQTDLYENEDGVFDPVSSPFADVRNGSIKAADYDRDGDMDVLITGESLSSGPTIQLFTNDGPFSFTLFTNTSLGSAKNSDADWADYNNDGYLDVLISGDNSVGPSFAPITVGYSYDAANDQFDPINIGSVSMTNGNILWGDFNNDNWPDFVVNGETGINPADKSSLLFRNDGQGGFNQDLFSSQNLKNMAQGSADWIDYDNDGQLDLIMTGLDDSNAEVFAVFHNIDTIASVQPPAPDSLEHRVVGATLVLEWEAPDGFDAATVNGLSYNLYFGPASDKEHIQSAHADLTNGYRKIHVRGNTQGNFNWRINNLPDGTYVWSVQTVDQGYEGSAFAPEQTLSFNNPQPLIVQEDFSEFIDWGGNNVESSIIIDDLNIVQEVAVYYRGVSDSSDFTRLVLNAPSNPYVFDISTELVDEIGVEYYFEVLGTTSGFNAYSDTGYTYINYPGGMPYEYTDMAFGKDVTDYNIISIPLVLSNNAISSTLEEFGEYDIFKWRFWHYQTGGSVEYTNGLNNIETGQGYWLITKESQSFNTGAGHTTRVKKSDPFSITLSPGWNQIGNPYAFNLSWNDILQANQADIDKIQGSPLGYSSAGYQAVTTVSEYRGVFVRANQTMSLKIPVVKNNSINRTGFIYEADLPSPDIHSAEWKLGIHMKSGGLTSRLAAIGMSPEANAGLDKEDWYVAPRPSQYLELNFSREIDSVKNFARDIVPTQKNFIWEFSVNSNLADPYVELSWNNESFGTSGLQLYLFDVERQKFVDMAMVSSYRSLSEKKTRKFKILFGSTLFIEEQIQADRVFLGLAYPSPANAEVHLPYSLPENGNLFDVKMEVLDQKGQLVAEWTKENTEGGFHEIIWDGNNNSGTRLPAGLYIYRLTVSEFGKQDIQVQKLILK